MNLPALTKGTAISSVSRLWYLGYVGVGLAIGIVVSSLVFAALMIRPRAEAIRVSLPRLPVATRSQFFVFGPILLGLLWVYFLANQYAPPGLMLVAPWLTELPVLAMLLGTVADLCLYRDAEGNRISYRERIARLREIHLMHDYFYLLNARGSSISVPPNASPKELQKAIRERFSDDAIKTGLRIQTLQEFRVKLYPKDGDPKNQASENLGVEVEVSDSNARNIRVRVWPKSEDPPRNVKELTVRLDVLERHALEFVRANAGQESAVPELLRHTINEAVKETLQEEAKFPLHDAACAGRQDLVEEHLSRGADVNERAAYGWTPLLMASAQGYPQMVKFMLEKGANPDIPNVQGITPLMYAGRYGNLQITKYLIDFGASIDLQDVFGDTALAVAVKNGHESIVRLLLSKGANIKIRNRDGQTPLDLAYKLGQGRIARLLRTKSSKKAFTPESNNESEGSH